MFRDILKLKPMLDKAAEDKKKLDLAIATQKIQEARVAEQKRSQESLAKFQQKLPETKETKAATVLQKHIRGHLVRKNFSIKQKPITELLDYKAFFVGNAPNINGLNRFKEEKEKIALIALSGARAILLACQLGNKFKTPKIFLIDNSHQVHSLWQALRKFAEKNETEELFLKDFMQFTIDHAEIFKNCNSARSLGKDFLLKLFTEHGYRHVRKIIRHTSLIKQDWKDRDTFIKLNNIISHLDIKIVNTFPSNLVSLSANKPLRRVILENIASTKPKLSIHTNLNPDTRTPDTVYLIENQKPEAVEETIFKQSTCFIQ